MGSSRAHPWRRIAKKGTVGVAVGEIMSDLEKLKQGESIEGFISEKKAVGGSEGRYDFPKKPQVGPMIVLFGPKFGFLCPSIFFIVPISLFLWMEKPK